MILQSLWRESAAKMRDAGIDTPLLDARLLLQQALGITYEQFLLNAKSELSQAQSSAFEALFARRVKREPLSHILGHKEFWGRNFKVTKDVLTPRADSEAIIQGVLSRITDHQSPATILDLGTGTGCLLLTLLAELPNARGVGVDFSKEALDIAYENAESLGLSPRVTFLHSRWCEQIPPQQFEIVVANPPYIPSNEVEGLMPEVAQFEPILALDGGLDGLKCYREIATALLPFTSANALVALEVGAGQQEDVARIMESEGFTLTAVLPDLSGIPRCLMFVKNPTRNPNG